MLLPLQEICDSLGMLAKRVSLPELQLRESRLGEMDLAGFESEIGTALPSSFREMLLEYDFGNVDIWGVWFASTGDYLGYLRKMNSHIDAYGMLWGGDCGRPEDLLIVAGTDGYVILLNLLDEEILAHLRTESFRDARKIADDFSEFLRGVGTTVLKRDEAPSRELLAMEVAEECGADSASQFWLELAMGYA